MDEYVVPNNAAVMERKVLLILDNAPSHASKLACEHHTTVLHGTSFNHSVHQISLP